VEVVKGFEYEPATRQAEVVAGRTTIVTVVLRRMLDLPAAGWHNGSTHVHMNYGGNLHNTPENLAVMAAAEDLHVVNTLVANKDNRVLDWQYFRPDRQEYPLKKPVPGVSIVFGEEYRPSFYGHMFLLGLRDHLISPFTSNYEGTALDSLYPTNTDILRKAQAQGGITGYVHPFGDQDPLESGSGPKGFPVDAALGALNALEWSGAVRAEMAVWHRLLNNDISLVPVGGEDSINDLHLHVRASRRPAQCRSVAGGPARGAHVFHYRPVARFKGRWQIARKHCETAGRRRSRGCRGERPVGGADFEGSVV
jgi:hypothetical protein